MIRTINPASGIAPVIAEDLEKELTWFREVLNVRLNLYFGIDTTFEDIHEVIPPELGDSSYANCIREFDFGFAERIALMLSQAPHLQPELLDVFFTKNATFDRPFSEFGGYTHPRHPGFLPTGQTLVFILSGKEIGGGLETARLFHADHPFSKFQILELDHGKDAGPPLSGALKLSTDYLHWFTTGQEYRPRFGARFPAQLIETQQEWTDLVLPERTLREIEEIAGWIKHGPTLMNDWGMARKLRPGYRCLFYGPPGTGKTMTACLLGKSTGRPVYKVDLSLVVSKYIGETEKNLARIFDQAEYKDWILFFDEADALFGRRTKIRDAHDRYANQEVSFLLQRVETFGGIVILASNQRENLDDAFTRRFESMIRFPMPKPEQRLRIWRQGFSPKAQLAAGVDLDQLAATYELSGGGIMNVVRYASLRALENSGVVKADDLLAGIKREYGKEGRMV
ncbi:MAG: ATP-binding protein [Lewinellaceae bacterium]|nr:ATP-binding protein [Lewinellaceae bacterium]